MASLTDPLGAARVVVHMLERASEFGLTISCSSNFDEFIALRSEKRGGPVSPMFDPAITRRAIGESFVKLMAAKKTPFASTLTIGDDYNRLVEHPEYLDQPLYVASFSAAERARLDSFPSQVLPGDTGIVPG